MGANQRIIGFFAGERPDGAGRYLSELQTWPDEQLESVHDFIQWMFPLTEPSPVNPDAPVLDEDTIREVRARPELQAQVRASFLRMQQFYEGSRHWISPNNHNHLRITRILKCLRLLGLEQEAREFFDWLAQIYDQERRGARPGIGERTFQFWTSASNVAPPKP
jgi:opioid growth factor receptor-like protein